jgi:hypothetical protein
VSLDEDPAVGLGAAPTSIRLWPGRALYVVDLGSYSRNLRGYQVRLPVHTSASGIPGHPVDGYSLGVLLAGPIYAIGQRAGYAWSRTADPGRELAVAEDHTHASRQIARPTRSLTLQWPDPIPEAPASPDVISAASGDLAAWYQDLWQLADVLLQVGSVPVLGIWDCPRPTGVACLTAGLRDRACYGWITGTLTTDGITGVSGQRAGRVSGWVIEEEP